MSILKELSKEITAHLLSEVKDKAKGAVQVKKKEDLLDHLIKELAVELVKRLKEERRESSSGLKKVVIETNLKDVEKGLAKADEKLVKIIQKGKVDEDAMVRKNAAMALAKIGDKRAVPALTEALKDKNEDVRQAAREALKKIKSEQEKKKNLL